MKESNNLILKWKPQIPNGLIGVMGPGQKFLTRVGSSQVSHLWFGFGFGIFPLKSHLRFGSGIGKFPIKNQIFQFFSLWVKKIFSG